MLALAVSIFVLTCAAGWAAPRTAADWRPRFVLASGATGFDGQRQGNQQQHRQEHLPQWFRQHQNLPPQAQERALRSEPGFNRLPPRQQQRLFNRLRQLNAMPPGRRERTLQRMEAMEKLSPGQRQQVRSTMRQVTQMPEDRRRIMRKAFGDLTQLPPEQRQSILDSPQFKGQFSDHERRMLGTLMSVQPYAPEQRPAAGVKYGEKD